MGRVRHRGHEVVVVVVLVSGLTETKRKESEGDAGDTQRVRQETGKVASRYYRREHASFYHDARRRKGCDTRSDGEGTLLALCNRGTWARADSGQLKKQPPRFCVRHWRHEVGRRSQSGVAGVLRKIRKSQSSQFVMKLDREKAKSDGRALVSRSSINLARAEQRR
jgi:hypothetical protein